MEKNRFIETFIATYLANICAKELDRACASGDHSYADHMPVEDAQLLAHKALEQLEALD